MSLVEKLGKSHAFESFTTYKCDETAVDVIVVIPIFL